MSLFNLFKKSPPKQESKILLAMPMFNNDERYQVDKVTKSLKSDWHIELTDIEGDDDSAAFKIDGETVAIAYIEGQIPWEDIEGTAQHAYNWLNALDELKDHTGHAIVTILAGQKSPLERFKILSKVISSILTTSNAIGVYNGVQSLLTPPKQYLDIVEELKEDGIPVPLWVYIGLRESATGNSAYTYGLTELEKQEMEIIDSKLDLEELYSFLLNITSYVIGNDITLRSGETFGYTVDQKIAVTLSEGGFIDGQSFKLKI